MRQWTVTSVFRFSKNAEPDQIILFFWAIQNQNILNVWFAVSSSSGKKYNCVIILGPTAVGKTAIGVAVARAFNGEIISADSRQTYRHLDIGSGKDLEDYAESADGPAVPYHLIDITELPAEYNVYNYQQDFYKAFKDITERGKLPVVVGGTGMYLDAIVRDYQLVILPENKKLHEELEATPLEVLAERLIKLQPDLHTKCDLLEKDRVIKALEIIEAKKQGVDSTSVQRPEINPLIIGTTLPRPQMWENISKRLRERLDCGMIEEVQSIHDSGISWERLEKLGLEYRFCSEYLLKVYENHQHQEFHHHLLHRYTEYRHRY